MKKPLLIALCISTALHIALLPFVVWPIDWPRPELRPDLRIVLERHELPETLHPAVETSQAVDEPPTQRSTEQTDTEKRSAATKNPHAALPGSPPQESARVPSDAVAPNARPTRTEVDAATKARPVPAATLVTEATSAASLPTLVKPFASRQQTMLRKKLRQWSETYPQLKARGDRVTWHDEGRRYTAAFTTLPADDMGLDRVLVDVATEIDGERVTTQMQLRRLAFSSYAQFVNRWDRNVQIHNDELDGRFHANSAINLTYSTDATPQFHGKVTTTARRINITAVRGRVRHDEMFLGGLQTGVRTIRLPKNFVPMPQTAVVGNDHVHEFLNDTRITFHADGSYAWVSFKDGLFERRGHLREPATYLIAADKATLHVRGTVHGKVLVYSPEGIVIADDLVYAKEGKTDAPGDDYIGLVSGKTIQVAPPKVTGRGDLEIHGALFAKRRFSVARYRNRRDGGTLKIFGSLTAGSISATEPRFATQIRYDPRLETTRPPGFPVTDRYELESWDAAWTVTNPAER